MPTLFTSYMCEEADPLVQKILSRWKKLNPNCEVLYFSDQDIDTFFANTEYNHAYEKLRQGVSKADFFRLCYIYTHGGYWFDIDIAPIHFTLFSEEKACLFDCGFGNISYMLLGGHDSPLFKKTIDIVMEKITNPKTKSLSGKDIMQITGPRVIQGIISEISDIKCKNGHFQSTTQPKIYLSDTPYRFQYTTLVLKSKKTQIYQKLQKKYNKKKWQAYHYI